MGILISELEARATLVALTERTEVLERVDAGRVVIAPGERDRVVTDPLELANLEVCVAGVGRRLDALDGAPMPLAMRARAVPSKDLVRKHGCVAVRPSHGHDASAVGSLHTRRSRARILHPETSYH